MWVRKRAIDEQSEKDEREFWSQVDPNERVMQIEVLRQRYFNMLSNKYKADKQGDNEQRLRRSARVIFQAWR